MKYHTINSERLGHLADELLSKYNEWYEYRVDTTLVKMPISLIERKQMPTLIAVLSENVKLFPDEWYLHPEFGFPYYRKDKFKDPCSSAMMFFQLDYLMFKHLFVPFRQVPGYFGGKMLGYTITPAEVGKNIREFMKNYKSIMN